MFVSLGFVGLSLSPGIYGITSLPDFDLALAVNFVSFVIVSVHGFCVAVVSLSLYHFASSYLSVVVSSSFSGFNTATPAAVNVESLNTA